MKPEEALEREKDLLSRRPELKTHEAIGGTWNEQDLAALCDLLENNSIPLRKLNLEGMY